MREPAIIIENLSKKYLKKGIGNTGSEKSFFAKYLNPVRFSYKTIENKSESNFTALNNINYTVYKGETIGIIGKNGSGKSTLLKILAGVTDPSSGEATFWGTVASVLDIGLGFHPDLTGMENIFLSGRLMGISKRNISENINKIIEFSGLEESIHTEVKNYSNGMFLRLSFSIALFVKADILLFDEILAAGDLEFRIKAIAAIKETVNSDNTTVVMVSHNLTEIAELCDKVVWLNKGSIVKCGDTLPVIAEYVEYSVQHNEPGVQKTDSLNNILKIKNVFVDSDLPANESVFFNSHPIRINVDLEVLSSKHNIDLGFTIFDGNSNPVFFTSTAFLENDSFLPESCTRATCIIPPDLLNSGTFLVSLVIIENKSDIILRMPKTTVFKVVFEAHDKAKIWENKLPGPIKPTLKWNIETK